MSNNTSHDEFEDDFEVEPEVSTQDSEISYEDDGSYDDDFDVEPEGATSTWWKKKPVIIVAAIVLTGALVPVKRAIFDKPTVKTSHIQLTSTIPQKRSQPVPSTIPQNQVKSVPPVGQSVGQLSVTNTEITKTPLEAIKPKLKPKPEVVSEVTRNPKQQDKTGLDKSQIIKIVNNAVANASQLKETAKINLAERKEIRKIKARLALALKEIHNLQKKMTTQKPTVALQPKIKDSTVKKAVQTPQASLVSNFWLQAIVPGQAWISSKKNKEGLFTISNGDILPDGASVVSIDATHNKVLTSGGDIVFNTTIKAHK